MLASCATSDPDMRPRFDEAKRYQEFRTYLIQVARDMKLGIAVMNTGRDEGLSLAQPLQLVKKPSLEVEGETWDVVPQYMLYISSDFLRSAIAEYMHFATAHEICNAKLGHFHLQTNEPQHEIEASGCACGYVGRMACIKAHKYHARLTRESKFSEMSEVELENHLKKLYGIISFVKP